MSLPLQGGGQQPSSSSPANRWSSGHEWRSDKQDRWRSPPGGGVSPQSPPSRSPIEIKGRELFGQHHTAHTIQAASELGFAEQGSYAQPSRLVKLATIFTHHIYWIAPDLFLFYNWYIHSSMTGRHVSGQGRREAAGIHSISSGASATAATNAATNTLTDIREFSASRFELGKNPMTKVLVYPDPLDDAMGSYDYDGSRVGKVLPWDVLLFLPPPALS